MNRLGRALRAFVGGTILTDRSPRQGHAATTDGAASVRTAVRSGNHPGFGRIVIDTIDGAELLSLDRTGDQVIDPFRPGRDAGTAATAAAQCDVAIKTEGSEVELTMTARRAGAHPCASTVVSILDVHRPET